MVTLCLTLGRSFPALVQLGKDLALPHLFSRAHPMSCQGLTHRRSSVSFGTHRVLALGQELAAKTGRPGSCLPGASRPVRKTDLDLDDEGRSDIHSCHFH